MADHTPGPWEILRRGNSLPEIVGPERPASRMEIDLMGMGEGSTTMNVIARIRPQSDRTDANARLIAAAPELLAALIQCRDQLVSVGQALGGYLAIDVDAMNAADAAIAKVLG